MSQSAFDFDRKPLPDITRRKHGGNARSVEANKTVDPWKPSVRRTIVELVAKHGAMTLAEICEAMEKQKNAVSGRMTELVRDGVLAVQGQREGFAIYILANSSPVNGVKGESK